MAPNEGVSVKTNFLALLKNTMQNVSGLLLIVKNRSKVLSPGSEIFVFFLLVAAVTGKENQPKFKCFQNDITL